MCGVKNSKYLFKQNLKKHNLDFIINLINEISEKDKAHEYFDFLNEVKEIKSEKLLELNDKYNEKMLAIESDNDYVKYLNGFIPYDKNLFENIISSSFVKKRCELEYDSSYRQLVTCAILKSRDRFLLFRKEDGATENRLVSLLGMPGGHCNYKDINDTSISFSLVRELHEEVYGFDVNLINYIEPFGIVKLNYPKDISSEHICFLYVIDVDSNNLSSREKEESSFWLSEQQVLESLNNLKLDKWASIAYFEYLNGCID